MSKVAAAALATPACVLAAGLALALMFGVVGRHPMWPDGNFNLSEAAAVRDEAEVVRLIEYGENPNSRRDVRPGLLFDSTVRLTPLEAAVASQRAEMVGLLLSNGAVLDPALWNQLTCLDNDGEVSVVLERYRPAGVTLRCEGVSPPW
jgi:hypothetical protein